MSTKRPSKRSWWKRLFGALAIVVVALVMLAALGLWWLSRHPISVGFLTPKIEVALSEQLSPLAVTLDDIVITWSRRHKLLELRARNARLLGASGDEIVTIDQLGVDLSSRSLLRGEIVPEAVALIETRVAAVRHPEGTIDLGLSDSVPRPQEPSGDEATGFVFIDQWLMDPEADGPLSKLDRIEIRDAKLTVEDRKLGATWGSDHFNVTLRRTEAGIEGDGQLSLRIAEDSAELSAVWTLERHTRILESQLEFTDLKPAILASFHPALERLKGFDRPIHGWIEADLAEGFQLRNTQFRLESDWGSAEAIIDFGDNPRTLSAELEVEEVKPWLLAETMRELEPLEAARLPVDGEANLQWVDGLLESLVFELTTAGGALELDQIFAAPLQISGANLTGKVQDGLAKIDLEEAQIELADGPTLTVQVSAQKEADRYHSALSASLDEISVDRLGTFWPEGVVEPVERWITTHIPAGMIHDLKLGLAADLTWGEARGFAVESLAGSFAYEDLQLDLFPPQPRVTNVDGLATFSTRGFDFDVEEGSQLADLELGVSRVVIDGFEESAPALTLDVPVNGSAETLVTVISGDPLTLLPPELLSGLSGRLEATLHLGFPFAGPINMSTIDLAAEADLQKLAWPETPLHFELTNGAAALHLTNDSLAFNGTARFNEVAAAIEYREFFKPDDLRRQIKAETTLDDEDLERLGMPEQSYLSGSTGVEFGLTIDPVGITRIEIDADLEQSLLAIPQIGWQKPLGVAGHITARIEELEDGWKVESIELAAADLTAIGKLELAAGPLRFRSANIDRLELAGSQVHSNVARDEQGDFSIGIGGRRIDASPLIAQFKQQVQDDKPEIDGPIDRPAVEVSVEVDELILTPQVTFQNLVAHATHNGQVWEGIDLDLSSGAGGRLTYDLAASHAGQKLTIAAHDFGDLAKVIDATNQIEGGSFEVSATRPSLDEPWTGQLVAESFTVLGHPMLARILKLGTLNNLLNTFQTEGLEFIRVECKLAGDRRRLELTEGRAHGRGLGITNEGWIDFEKKSLYFSGAVAPATSIRKVLGKIPIVKQILYGRRQTGVFATLYSVSGSFDDIKVSVNPISTLTPGIAREILKLVPDEERTSND